MTTNPPRVVLEHIFLVSLPVTTGTELILSSAGSLQTDEGNWIESGNGFLRDETTTGGFLVIIPGPEKFSGRCRTILRLLRLSPGR